MGNFLFPLWVIGLACPGAAATWAGNESIGIPIKYQADGRPLVDCVFNEVHAPCLLDTGSYLVIFPASLKKFAETLPDAGAARGYLPKECRTEKSLVNFKIGEFDSPVKAAVKCDGEWPEVGNVGIPALGPLVWKFDLKNGQLTVVEKIPETLKVGELKRSAAGHIAIQVTIGQSEIVVGLDTGAQTSYLDEVVRNRNKKNFTEMASGYYKVSVVKAGGAVFSLRGTELIRLADDPLYKGITRDSWSGVLGDDFLKGHVWYFDFKNNRWAVSP